VHDAAETLFIISKTFTTLGMTRDRAGWLLKQLGGNQKAVARHFVVVSTNARRSPVGMTPPTCLSSGLGWRPLFDGVRHRPDDDRHRPRQFRAMLAGSPRWMNISARAVREKPSGAAALLGICCSNFFDAPTIAVLP
jgi:glucose-6-phosphate isomerase